MYEALRHPLQNLLRRIPINQFTPTTVSCCSKHFFRHWCIPSVHELVLKAIFFLLICLPSRQRTWRSTTPHWREPQPLVLLYGTDPLDLYSNDHIQWYSSRRFTTVRLDKARFRYRTFRLTFLWLLIHKRNIWGCDNSPIPRNGLQGSYTGARAKLWAEVYSMSSSKCDFLIWFMFSGDNSLADSTQAFQRQYKWPKNNYVGNIEEVQCTNQTRFLVTVTQVNRDLEILKCMYLVTWLLTVDVDQGLVLWYASHTMKSKMSLCRLMQRREGCITTALICPGLTSFKYEI